MKFFTGAAAFSPLVITLPTVAGNRWTVDWRAWQPAERAVLCFVRQEGRLLLIVKKRGLGAGRVSAPGGRIEPGETPAAAAVRETQEEVGITPINPRVAGDVQFAFSNGYNLACTIFVAALATGTPVETPEAEPFWQPEGEIPYDRMWADDRVWLPRLLAGQPFRGAFMFDDDRMLWHRLMLGNDA